MRFERGFLQKAPLYITRTMRYDSMDDKEDHTAMVRGSPTSRLSVVHSFRPRVTTTNHYNDALCNVLQSDGDDGIETRTVAYPATCSGHANVSELDKNDCACSTSNTYQIYD